MRSSLFVLSLAVLGCGGASTTPPVASTPAPIEAVAEPLCAVELHDGSAWVKRADLACPTDALNLLVVGDVGHANPVLDSSVAGAKAVCAERRCDLMLVAGDLIYGPGADAEPHWAKIWDAGLATLNLPAVAVLGNHEWRHEPEPEKKRAAVFASDGRLGLIAPSPSFAVRITRDGKPIAAVAALDTDSVSNPAPEMPGLGAAAFDLACGEGVPVIAVGHHPPTSQGLHHGHEAEVEAALRTTFATRRQAGCDVRLVVAGHDHDLQVYPKSCEQADVPAIVVAGVTGRGFRKAGEQHLPKCGPGPSEGRDTVYVADRGTDGGFAHVEFALGAAESSARLYATPAPGGPPSLLHTTSF
jgi:3',5'-cyclic AMP phosphodiesterase CpdA